MGPFHHACPRALKVVELALVTDHTCVHFKNIKSGLKEIFHFLILVLRNMPIRCNGIYILCYLF